MPNPSSAIAYEQLSEIRVLLERHSGILLERMAEVLPERIADYVAAKRLNSPADLLSLLRISNSECDAVLERLLASEGRFFQYPPAFEALEKKVIPEVRLRKFWDSPRRLQIWCAGCGNGEEAYSIAIVAAEAMDALKGWEIRIVGSDLNRHALQEADRGLYQQSVLSGTPIGTAAAHFLKVGEHFLIKPELRRLVSFVPGNLSHAEVPGKFDAIFCMDVLPYLPEAQRTSVLRRFHHVLEPGGYLFLAPGETPPRAGVKFHTHTFSSYRLYQKPPTRSIS